MKVYEEDVEEFLEHYGVKGMRWGVRRAQASKSGPGRRALYKVRKKFKARQEKTGTVTGLTPKQEVLAGGLIAAGTIYVAKRMARENIRRQNIRRVSSLNETMRKARVEQVYHLREMGRHKEAQNLQYYHDRLRRLDEGNLHDAMRGFRVTSEGVAERIGRGGKRVRPSKIGFKVGKSGVATALHSNRR